MVNASSPCRFTVFSRIKLITSVFWNRVLKGILTVASGRGIPVRKMNRLSASRLFFLKIIIAIAKGTTKLTYIAGLNVLKESSFAPESVIVKFWLCWIFDSILNAWPSVGAYCAFMEALKTI